MAKMQAKHDEALRFHQHLEKGPRIPSKRRLDEERQVPEETSVRKKKRSWYRRRLTFS